MTYLAKAILICDRCGARLDVDPTQGDSELMSICDKIGTPVEGWRGVGRRSHLCPECAEGYELLMERQRAERADYVHAPLDEVR